MARLLLWPLALFALSGCYGYAAVQDVPGAGTDVRVAVSDEEALRLSRQTGRLARAFDGRLEGAGVDSIIVSVVTFRAASDATRLRQFRQSVVIPRAGIDAIETRQFSLWRSAVAGSLVGAAVYVAIDRVLVGGSADDVDPDPGEPIGTLIPIIRIPIGR